MCYGQPPLPPHVLSALKQHHTLEVECLNQNRSTISEIQNPRDHLRLQYAMAKKVNFVIENPSSTLLWRYVPLRELWLRILHAAHSNRNNCCGSSCVCN